MAAYKNTPQLQMSASCSDIRVSFAKFCCSEAEDWKAYFVCFTIKTHQRSPSRFPSYELIVRSLKTFRSYPSCRGFIQARLPDLQITFVAGIRLECHKQRDATFASYGSFSLALMTSGARYAGVPTVDPGAESLSCCSSDSCTSMLTALI